MTPSSALLNHAGTRESFVLFLHARRPRATPVARVSSKRIDVRTESRGLRTDSRSVGQERSLQYVAGRISGSSRAPRYCRLLQIRQVDSSGVAACAQPMAGSQRWHTNRIAG